MEEYKITFYRERGGAKRLMFYVRGGEAVTRAVKLVEVLTGEKPQVTEIPDGKTRIRGSDKHIRDPGPLRRAKRGDREVEQPVVSPPGGYHQSITSRRLHHQRKRTRWSGFKFPRFFLPGSRVGLCRFVKLNGH